MAITIRALSAPEFAKIQAKALDAVDAKAMASRGKFVTIGKDMVYTQKQNEARAAIDDLDPAALQAHPVSGVPIMKYPHLDAMIGKWVPNTGVKNDDLKAAALYVLGKAADLKQISGQIESALDTAKQAISVATTKAQVDAAVAGLTLP